MSMDTLQQSMEGAGRLGRHRPSRRVPPRGATNVSRTPRSVPEIGSNATALTGTEAAPPTPRHCPRPQARTTDPWPKSPSTQRRHPRDGSTSRASGVVRGRWTSTLTIPRAACRSPSMASRAGRCTVVAGEVLHGSGAADRGRRGGLRGGLGDGLPPATLADVLADIRAATGETPRRRRATTTSGRRSPPGAGHGAQAVAELARVPRYVWRVRADGTLWLGAETWPDATAADWTFPRSRPRARPPTPSVGTLALAPGQRMPVRDESATCSCGGRRAARDRA